MTTQRQSIKLLKIAGWVLLIVVLGVVTVLFWPFIGLLIAVLIPVLLIGSVIRSFIRDLRGKRHDYPLVTGRVSMSDIPEKPKTIRHFTTPNGRSEE